MDEQEIPVAEESPIKVPQDWVELVLEEMGNGSLVAPSFLELQQQAAEEEYLRCRRLISSQVPEEYRVALAGQEMKAVLSFREWREELHRRLEESHKQLLQIEKKADADAKTIDFVEWVHPVTAELLYMLTPTAEEMLHKMTGKTFGFRWHKGTPGSILAGWGLGDVPFRAWRLSFPRLSPS